MEMTTSILLQQQSLIACFLFQIFIICGLFNNNVNSLTGAGAFSRPDDASYSLALARFSALIHSSHLCCLGTHQAKTYL
jgi:hypothetical protein